MSMSKALRLSIWINVPKKDIFEQPNGVRYVRFDSQSQAQSFWARYKNEFPTKAGRFRKGKNKINWWVEILP